MASLKDLKNSAEFAGSKATKFKFTLHKSIDERIFTQRKLGEVPQRNQLRREGSDAVAVQGQRCQAVQPCDARGNFLDPVVAQV